MLDVCKLMSMNIKKSSQNIYLQLFCFEMFVIDLIVGINYL